MPNKTEVEQLYKVGDHVRIKDHPVACAFVWVGSMTKYCGATAIIENAKFNSSKGCWRYEIDLDHRYCGWCENCFEPVVLELPEFDTSDVDILNLLS